MIDASPSDDKLPTGTWWSWPVIRLKNGAITASAQVGHLNRPHPNLLPPDPMVCSALEWRPTPWAAPLSGAGDGPAIIG